LVRTVPQRNCPATVQCLIAIYHFDYRDNGKLIADYVGTPLDSFEEANVEAVRPLAELAKGALQGPERRQLAIEVRAVDQPVLQIVLTLEVGPLI
jgi:hypothetical protein